MSFDRNASDQDLRTCLKKCKSPTCIEDYRFKPRQSSYGSLAVMRICPDRRGASTIRISCQEPFSVQDNFTLRSMSGRALKSERLYKRTRSEII